MCFVYDSVVQWPQIIGRIKIAEQNLPEYILIQVYIEAEIFFFLAQQILSILFQDGSKVFTASCDKTAKMWDLNSNQAIQIAQVRRTCLCKLGAAYNSLREKFSLRHLTQSQVYRNPSSAQQNTGL